MDNSFRTDFLDILWYKDGYGDKVSREITNEGHIVTNGLIVLDEIPDAFYKVEVAGMYETDIKNSLISAEFFKVDYDHAKIYFHPDLEGKTVNVSRYFSRGIIKLSAKRVFDEIDGQVLDSNKIDKTLQDFINSIKSIQFEEFDVSKVYTPNKCVLYHGSTFRCIKTTFNHELPTNTEYWEVMSAGLNYRDGYTGGTNYDLRDIVSYIPERAIYICIQPTNGTQLPTDTNYWLQMLSLKDEVDLAIEKANLADLKANYANEQGDYALAQGDYAKQEGGILSQIITDFTYIGEYNSAIEYVPKNVVIYNGSTYINKVACNNVLPTDINNWQILASGFVYKGDYDNTVNYELRDMVYYEPEKTIYFCIKSSKGNVPTNTTFWIKSLSVKSETDYATAQGNYAKVEGDFALEKGTYANEKGAYALNQGDYAKQQGDFAKVNSDYAIDEVNKAQYSIDNVDNFYDNLRSLFVAHDAGIVINHNLNKYPLPLAIATSSGYGCSGFGNFGYGSESIFQIGCRAEYLDLNNIALYFDEQFEGTPILTKISDTQYQVDFDNDIGVMIELK